MNAPLIGSTHRVLLAGGSQIFQVKDKRQYPASAATAVWICTDPSHGVITWPTGPAFESAHSALSGPHIGCLFSTDRIYNGTNGDPAQYEIVGLLA